MRTSGTRIVTAVEAMAAAALIAALAAAPASGAAAPARAPALSIAVVPATPLAPGQSALLTLRATSPDGPLPKEVSWKVTAGGAAHVTFSRTGPHGTAFTASAPGRYVVAARGGGAVAETAIGVYGAPAAVALTPAQSSRPADGRAQAALTATVEDAYGTPVFDFLGLVTVSDTEGQLCDAPNGDASPNAERLHVAEGSAPFTICGNGKNALEDTVTASDLEATATPTGSPVPLTGIRYETASVDSVRPTPASLSIALGSGAPTVFSDRRAMSAAFRVSVLDAAGNPIGAAPQGLVVSLTGPGSFAKGRVTTRRRVDDPWKAAVRLYNRPGRAGTIRVTASANGFPSAAFSIGNDPSLAPAGLAIARTATRTDADGMPYATYTVSLVDGRGHPIGRGTDVITVTDNAASQTTANLEPTVYGTERASLRFSDMAAQWTAPGPPPTLYMFRGTVAFSVETAAAGTSPVTLSATDSVHHFRASARYAWGVGAPEDLVLQPSSWLGTLPNWTFTPAKCGLPAAPQACAYQVLPGQPVAYAARLTDAAANPVPQPGVPVQFGFFENAVGAVWVGGGATDSAVTDATGAAEAAVIVPEGAAPTGPTQANFGAPYRVDAYLNGSNVGGPVYVGAPYFAVVANVAAASDYAARVTVSGVPASPIAVGRTLTPKVSVVTASGAPITQSVAGTGAYVDDVLEFTSANPSAVRVFDFAADTYDPAVVVRPTLHGSAPLTWRVPALKAVGAGTSVITVEDPSNPSEPTATFTLRVRGAHR